MRREKPQAGQLRRSAFLLSAIGLSGFGALHKVGRHPGGVSRFSPRRDRRGIARCALSVRGFASSDALPLLVELRRLCVVLSAGLGVRQDTSLQ